MTFALQRATTSASAVPAVLSTITTQRRSVRPASPALLAAEVTAPPRVAEETTFMMKRTPNDPAITVSQLFVLVDVEGFL